MRTCGIHHIDKWSSHVGRRRGTHVAHRLADRTMLAAPRHAEDQEEWVVVAGADSDTVTCGKAIGAGVAGALMTAGATGMDMV